MKKDKSDFVKEDVIASDAMSSKREVTLTFPTYGTKSVTDTYEYLEQLRTSHAPRTIVAAKTFAEGVNLDTVYEPLTREHFIQQAITKISAAENYVEGLPEKYHADMKQAIGHAFRAGGLLTEEFMRNRHLVDVEREVGMKKARKRGGKAGLGNIAEGTQQLVDRMKKLIIDGGHSAANAARIATREGLGAEKGEFKQRADANRKRYSEWKNRAAQQ